MIRTQLVWIRTDFKTFLDSRWKHFSGSSLLGRSRFRSHNNWSGRAGNAFSSIGKTSSTTDFITNPFNGTVRNSYQNLINSRYFILRYISVCNSCSYGRMVYIYTWAIRNELAQLVLLFLKSYGNVKILSVQKWKYFYSSPT